MYLLERNGLTMKTKLEKFILRLLFGSCALDGFYDPKAEDNTPKKYVFGSVFPDQKTMEEALKIIR